MKYYNVKNENYISNTRTLYLVNYIGYFAFCCLFIALFAPFSNFKKIGLIIAFTIIFVLLIIRYFMYTRNYILFYACSNGNAYEIFEIDELVNIDTLKVYLDSTFKIEDDKIYLFHDYGETEYSRNIEKFMGNAIEYYRKYYSKKFVIINLFTKMLDGCKTEVFSSKNKKIKIINIFN